MHKIMRKTRLKIQMLAGNSFISRPDSNSQKKLTLVHKFFIALFSKILARFDATENIDTLRKHHPPDKGNKKHERPRRPGYNHREAYDNSSEDILSNEEDEETEVHRKISERRSELNRARRNGDDCHVS